MDSPIDLSAPAGFFAVPMEETDTYTAAAGPWYAKDEDGRLVCGFHVLPQHTNRFGRCHGGMLATFCDAFLCWSAAYQELEVELGLMPTCSLSLDYLLPVPKEAWIEGRADLLRRGSQLVYAQAVLTSQGKPVVRANAIYSVTAKGDALAVRQTFQALFASAPT